MAATNTTAKKTNATPVAAKPAATTRTTTTSTAANNVSTSTATAATNMKSSSPQTADTGLLSGLNLATFLGLPTVIDYQDIAIRVTLVFVGVVLFILVAWAFVRGKQSTQINVQVPSTQGATRSGTIEEAAEVAA